MEETYQEDVIGTLASEDTALILAKDEAAAKRISAELDGMLGKD